jgi:hypothetical protein
MKFLSIGILAALLSYTYGIDVLLQCTTNTQIKKNACDQDISQVNAALMNGVDGILLDRQISPPAWSQGERLRRGRELTIKTNCLKLCATNPYVCLALCSPGTYRRRDLAEEDADVQKENRQLDMSNSEAELASTIKDSIPGFLKPIINGTSTKKKCALALSDLTCDVEVSFQ